MSGDDLRIIGPVLGAVLGTIAFVANIVVAGFFPVGIHFPLLGALLGYELERAAFAPSAPNQRLSFWTAPAERGGGGIVGVRGAF